MRLRRPRLPVWFSSKHLLGYVNVSSSELALQHAVATVGPVAVAIDAAHDECVFYGSGVYYNPQCKSDDDDLDHEVLVVGYGTDDNGADYWIVKNSWYVTIPSLAFGWSPLNMFAFLVFFLW